MTVGDQTDLGLTDKEVINESALSLDPGDLDKRGTTHVFGGQIAREAVTLRSLDQRLPCQSAALS